MLKGFVGAALVAIVGITAVTSVDIRNQVIPTDNAFRVT
jgi:hypothetical protein